MANPLPGPYEKTLTFKPRWRAPISIAEWPPKGYEKVYEVKDETFWDVGRKFGRDNPWDIIIFNFKTEDPFVVNWYLYHAVGCTHSEDGKNFGFWAAQLADGTTGKIYIPPSSWRPDPSFSKGSTAGNFLYAIKSEITSILNYLGGRMPTIRAGGTTISGNGMRKVAQLMSGKDIIVDIDPSIGSANAEYEPLFSIVRFGRPPNRANIASIGTVANEATHIYNHYMSRDIYDGFREEVASSIASGIAMAIASEAYMDREILGAHWDTHFSARLFVGYAWLNALSAPVHLSDTDFDIEVAHPRDGVMRNPLKELQAVMMTIKDYKKKKGVQGHYQWEII